MRSESLIDYCKHIICTKIIFVVGSYIYLTIFLGCTQSTSQKTILQPVTHTAQEPQNIPPKNDFKKQPPAKPTEKTSQQVVTKQNFATKKYPSTTATLPSSSQKSTNSKINKTNQNKSSSNKQNTTMQHLTNTADSVESTESPTPDLSQSTNTPYKILPLQIHFNDIINTTTLRDNDQSITLKQSTQEDFVLIEVFDSNGNLRATLSFKNNLLEGVSRAYRNGQILREVPYKAGLIDGIMHTYILETQPQTHIEESYKAGKKHGATKVYYGNKLVSIKEYTNGMINGVVTTYPNTTSHNNQAFTTKTHYQAGNKEGESSGYAQGEIIFKQHYYKDFLQGETQTYGQGGILKITRHYNGGLLDGEEIVYDYPSQNPLYKSHYMLGILISPYENYPTNASPYYSLKPQDSKNPITKDIVNSNQYLEIWRYTNDQVALEIIQSPNQTKRIRSYQKDGQLMSDFTLSATQASGTFYANTSIKESTILYAPRNKTVWLYNADGSLRTKTQEIPAKNITQTYRNDILISEIIWLEGQEVTIQKGFFPNGALEFEHHYVENIMIRGVLYARNGTKIYEFTHTSQDAIFDEAFPNTAALKRAKVIPKR